MSEVGMSNQLILSKLKEKANNQNIKLTSLMGYDLTGKTLTLTIKDPCANMQTNESAFEAWAIVIKSAFGDDIERVVLNIESQYTIPKDNGHYHRLLWRIFNFSEMFDWFVIGNCKTEVSFFENEKFKKVLINKPSRNRIEEVDISFLTTEEKDIREGERYVESLFADPSQPYNKELSKLIGSTVLLNQIPVGLFQGEVKIGNEILTRGASAIDLVGFEGDKILHLIELKKGMNYSLGILSEFLLYTYIMHGVFFTKTITYPDYNFPSHFEKYKDYIQQGSIQQIKGHLLFEKIHPLIDKESIQLLNEGLKHFNTSIDRIIYTYTSTDKITNIRHYEDHNS